jgi:hypothetical protein
MVSKRSKLALLATLAVTAALLCAVAPALSTTPYVPAADDFTQPLPAAARLGESAPTPGRAEKRLAYGADGPVLFRTAPITAPHRFDFVGVEGEMHALEFRTRSGEQPWSDWVETDNGDPVYAGGADQVQVRSRDVAIAGRLHYVNVSGDETAGDGLLTSVRSRVNSAVVSLFGTEEAMASSHKPRFISREEWGADRKKGGCEPRRKPDYGKVKAGVIHHTVSTNTYTEAEAPSLVLGICRYHRDSNGWDDIGYNALVDRFGNLYEGRAGGLGKAVVGAQTEGMNTYTAGIATIGDHSSRKATPAERRGLVTYLAWRLDRAGTDASGHTFLRSGGGSSNRTPEGKRVKVKKIVGHGDLGFTECPGDRLHAQVGKIRREVQDRIEGFGGGDPDDPGDGTGGTGGRHSSGGTGPGA